MLPALIDSLEKVDEAFRSEYKEADGGMFRLDVEAVDGWNLEDVGGLRSTMEKEMKLRKQYEKDVKSKEGISIEEYNAAINKAKEFDGKNSDERIEALKADYQAQLSARDEAHNATISDMKDKSWKESINGQISSAMLDNHVISEKKAFIEDHLRLRINNDENFGTVLKDHDGNILKDPNTKENYNVNSYIKSLNASGSYPEFFQQPQASGAGAHGSSGESGGNGKTLNRQQYGQLQPQAQIDFTKGGGKVTE